MFKYILLYYYRNEDYFRSNSNIVIYIFLNYIVIMFFSALIFAFCFFDEYAEYIIRCW